MPVIAMTHEIGTLGEEVAAELALRLDVEFADQLFLQDRIVDRLAGGKALFTDRQPLQPRPEPHDRSLQVDERCLARCAEDEVRELAAYGNVLVRGWGAPTILRGCPHIFRVRVTAPIDARLANLRAASRSQGTAALRRQIESSDACLASNLEPMFGPGWRAGDIYHLVLGMHKLSVSDAVDLIAAYIEVAVRQDEDLFEQPTCCRHAPRDAGFVVADPASIARAEQALFGAR